jgi:hypothetical protein
VIDERTIYLRMPKTYMESETLLMVLRNLLRGAHDREVNGTPLPAAAPPTPAKGRTPQIAAGGR